MTNEDNKLIESIKKGVLRKFPLLGATMSNMEFVQADAMGLDTCATDGERVFYSENFLNNLSDAERIFAVSHELMHIAFDHILRSKGKDADVWNYATDSVINQMLKSEDLWWNGAFDMKEAVNKSAEEMYDILMEEKRQQQNRQGTQGQNNQNASSQNNQQSGQSQNQNGQGQNGNPNNQQGGQSNQSQNGQNCQNEQNNQSQNSHGQNGQSQGMNSNGTQMPQNPNANFKNGQNQNNQSGERQSRDDGENQSQNEGDGQSQNQSQNGESQNSQGKSGESQSGVSQGNSQSGQGTQGQSDNSQDTQSPNGQPRSDGQQSQVDKSSQSEKNSGNSQNSQGESGGDSKDNENRDGQNQSGQVNPNGNGQGQSSPSQKPSEQNKNGQSGGQGKQSSQSGQAQNGQGNSNSSGQSLEQGIEGGENSNSNQSNGELNTDPNQGSVDLSKYGNIHSPHSMWEDAVKRAEKREQENKKSNKLSEFINKFKKIDTDKLSKSNETNVSSNKMGTEKSYDTLEKDFIENNKELKKEIASRIRSRLNGSSNCSKGDGSGGGLTENYGYIEQQKAILSWKKLLKSEIESEESRWSYRRSDEDNYYQARIGSIYEQNKPLVQVMIDTSGSVSKTMIKQFLAQTKTLLKDCIVFVSCFDEKVYGFSQIKTQNDIDQFVIRGGGGTSFDTALKGFSKDKRVYKIIFTDGEDTVTPTIDVKKMQRVIWLVWKQNSFKPCTGRVIRVDPSTLKTTQRDDGLGK